jgi:8-oxo-dGTP pyrophosphatase MutT (NUDIX family)
MLRRILHFYWRFSRGMTLGVRAAVLDEARGVLLVRHSYSNGWHFPGGGVEPGETLLAALEKELLEEGNVRLRGTPRLHGIFHNAGASRRDHVALFVVREFDWLGPKSPTAEIRAAQFFALDRLPEDTTPGTRRRLGEILGGAEVDPRW